MPLTVCEKRRGGHTPQEKNRRENKRMDIKWHEGVGPHMKINETKGVTYLTFPALEGLPGILHGFSTRLGGVSRGIYSSMNLSFTRGDEKEAVRENFRRISGALGFLPEDIVASSQTHTANVRVMTEADKGNGVTRPGIYEDVDGMITNVPGVVLATFYADCVPLYFVDPVRKAVGLSHSGWRGTVGKIGAETVKKMGEVYGSRPENIYGAIGPSICQECYEVSEDVILEFQKVFEEKDWKNLYYRKENGKYQLDLWEANRRIMETAGLLPEHISLPGICTCCNPEFLFSHRATKGKRGNLGAFLGITEERK